MIFCKCLHLEILTERPTSCHHIPSRSIGVVIDPPEIPTNSPQIREDVQSHSRPPMVVFRKPRSVKDHIVRTRLDNPRPIGYFETCTDRCKLCPYTHTTSSFKSTNTKHEYKIFEKLSCKSKMWCILSPAACVVNNT